MSEFPKQYSEGPWQRVSGEVPFTQDDVEGLQDILTNMYGEGNWHAQPTSEDRGEGFDILVSPDKQNLDALLARKADEEEWPELKTEAVITMRAAERAASDRHKPNPITA